jgi:cell division protein FtsL
MRERKREVLGQNKAIKEKIKNQSGFIKVSLLIAVISGILIISGASYVGIKQYQNYQVKNLLVKINESINLMDTIKDKMPKELLEVHEYLMSGALGGKLYRVDPKLKNQIMYHGAKTQSVYINPDITLKKEL